MDFDNKPTGLNPPLRNEVFSRARSWLDVNRIQFKLSHARSHVSRLRLIKPLGELALTASILGRFAKSQEWSHGVLDYCWREFGEGDVLINLLAARPDLVIISTLYANFASAGFSNHRLESLLRYLSSSANTHSIEFPTWRRLDLYHGCAQLGLMNFPSQPELGTWLSGFPEPWMISEDTAYAVTHEVFYISDFGRLPSRINDEIRSYLRLWIPAWLRIYSCDTNCDLFAEFLMVAACVGISHEGMWVDLQGCQNSDGFFPGPGQSAENLLSSQMPQERRIFLQNYHTTLVCLMAMAMNG